MCLKILIFPQKIRSGFAFYIEKMIYQQIFMLKKHTPASSLLPTQPPDPLLSIG